MSGHVPSVVASARSAPPRDFDGIFKALLDAHPRDALQLLCGATLRDGDVITPEPTEQPRQRTANATKWSRSGTKTAPPPTSTKSEVPWRPSW